MNESSISGLALSERFYFEAVLPLIEESFPRLGHSAALIGAGSEVLGFDDGVSTDHHFGPRVMLFVSEADHAAVHGPLVSTLRDRLPHTFCGFPTNFSYPDPGDGGTQLLEPISDGPVNHRVEVLTVPGFFRAFLGIDPSVEPAPADWLTLPQQRLRAVTSGAVYRDDIGLQAARDRFSWYPHDVWLYLLAAGWARIGQEEHLMGRAGQVGDALGSALVGARLVRDVMRLAFLIERTYAPYAKWFGTAFRQLDCSATLGPILEAAIGADTWEAREGHLVDAYETIARLHNGLQVTEPIPQAATAFFGRPFRVIAANGFSDALLRTITDPRVQTIAERPPIGNIDLISDNTDLLEPLRWGPVLRKLYE